MAQDSALSNALARQEVLRREIEDRQEEMKDIDTFLSLYQRFAVTDGSNRPDESEMPGATNDVSQLAANVKPRLKRGGLTQPKFEQILRELLVARGQPAMRRELLDLFRESGNAIGGTDEMQNLGTKLWYARAMLTNIRGAGYWPADVPCAAVGYVPPQEDANDGDNSESFTSLHSAAAE
jgi:hypothetical protein